MNYSELVTAVSDYVENAFATGDMNTFIRQAERRIYTDAQFANLRKSATGALVMGVAYLDAPSDFIAPHSFAVISASGAYAYLLDKEVEFIREAYPNPTTTGTPRHYAIFGPQTLSATALRFILGPTPSAAFNYELQYFYFPESIVTATTTWLGDNFDPVLLYGTLVEAYTFMKGEPDMLQLYESKYKEALAQAQKLAMGMQRVDSYRTGMK